MSAEPASRAALAALAVLLLAACDGEPCDMRFERLRTADRMAVSTEAGKQFSRTITDQAQIAQVVQFAVDHEAGWRAPWAGTPIPTLRAEFYRGSTFLGDFGVGGNFLEAQGCSGFQSRSITPPDRQRIVALLGSADSSHRTTR